MFPPAAGNSSPLCLAAAGPISESSSTAEQRQQQHRALRRRSLLLLGLFAGGAPCVGAELSPGSPVATGEVNDLALQAINAYRYSTSWHWRELWRGVGRGAMLLQLMAGRGVYCDADDGYSSC